jgi:hypothetical protein
MTTSKSIFGLNATYTHHLWQSIYFLFFQLPQGMDAVMAINHHIGATVNNEERFFNVRLNRNG